MSVDRRAKSNVLMTLSGALGDAPARMPGAPG